MLFINLRLSIYLSNKSHQTPRLLKSGGISINPLDKW
jgi:hypothetical protein